jgi:hypothetical protein
MDFWVNLWALSLAFMAESIIVINIAWNSLLIPLAAAIVAYATFHMAKSAAIQWGHWVKAAFDTFLPDLCKKMNFEIPPSRTQEVDFWDKFSRAIIYRRADRLDELAHWRKLVKSSPGDSPNDNQATIESEANEEKGEQDS